MPWPPVEAPAGEGSAATAEDDEQEQPLAPDPRWPRLFAVGLGSGAVRLEQGGDHRAQQRAADRGAPAAGLGSPGDRPSGSPPPPWPPRQPDGRLQDAGAATAAAPTPPMPEGQAGPVTEPVAGESGDPWIAGLAKTEQMVSGTSTSASGTPSGAHANMAPADLSSPSVSPETEGGGGVVKQRSDDPSIEEDEAAIAVREAVSRAAAQAGVDVSRETSTDGLVEPTAAAPPGALVEALGDIPRIDSEAAARNARVTFKIHTDGANGHGRIVAVANQKGGVGKSTTAVNLGAYLALAGARILVVDLDPQGNASTGLGLDHREVEPSIYDVLTGETPPATAIRATAVANLHVLPSTIDLAGAEVELVSTMSREGRLGRALESIHQYYDTVLVDCPPSLGLLTVNALAAADELLIPIQCEYYALEGLGQLLRNVELVRANLNPELRIGGIVLTMYDGRTRLAEQVVGEVRKHFSDLVYQTVVPRSVRLSEAPGYGLPIALYDPLSRGGIAYRDLAFELAERSGLLAPTGEGAI
jgi:chromosome partitioning protein